MWLLSLNFLFMITKTFTLTRQKKTWFFEPSKSSGSLEDEIFTINMIAFALAEFSRYPGDPVLGQVPHIIEARYLTIHFSSFRGTFWENCSGHFGDDDYPFMRGMLDLAFKLCNEELFIKVMCGQTIPDFLAPPSTMLIQHHHNVSSWQARVGNLTFDGIDSQLLYLDDDGSELGDVIRLVQQQLVQCCLPPSGAL